MHPDWRRTRPKSGSTLSSQKKGKWSLSRMHGNVLERPIDGVESVAAFIDILRPAPFLPSTNGPSDPATTRVKSTLKIDGHKYRSICSTTISVLRAWLTCGL